MNIGECMEYAQKLCDATTTAERSSARAELRAAIAATVAAERERSEVLRQALLKCKTCALPTEVRDLVNAALRA